MRHRKAGRKLGRTTSHRKAMLRNIVTSFMKHEKIVTTDAKAKELRKIAEKIITLGKKDNLHARRQVLSFIRDRAVVKKLFEELSAAGEHYVPTRHEKIVRTQNGASALMQVQGVWDLVHELIGLAGQGDEPQMRDKLREIVPEYCATPEVGEIVGSS